MINTIKRHSSVPFGKSAISGMNKILSIALIIFLSLTPIPLGSNRPVFWALGAIFLSIITLIYLTFLLNQKSQLRHKLSRCKISLILFYILLAFIILQTIPFENWVNISNIISPIDITIEGIAIIGNSLSLTPGMSILSLIQFASYGLLFFLLLQVAYNSERAQILLIWVFIIVVAYATYSIFALTQLNDSILFMDKWAYDGVATATFVNRNSFATFLSFGLIIGVAFSASSLLPNNNAAGHKKNALSSMLFALGATIIGVALIATQSRMGFASGVLGSFITLILVLSKSPKSHKLKYSVFILGIIALGFLLFLYGDGLFERLTYVESSADGRMALYAQIIEMIKNRPFLGYGAGSFELAFPLFHQFPVSPDVVWDKAHNSYLALWSELGVIVGSIPILIIILIGITSWRIYKTAQRRWLYSAIALGAISTAAIHSLVDFSLEIQAVAFLFVAILAIGISGPNKSSSDKNNA